MSSIVDVQTINWILTAIATVLTAGRLVIRYSNTRRFYADDAVHTLALAMLITHGATNQVTLAAKARQKVLIAPAAHTSVQTQIQTYQHLHVLNTVNNVFLYAIMWTVKVAFLLLYRQIFTCHRAFLRVWWFVLAFVLLSYIPPFAGVVYTCSHASTLSDYKACNTGSSFRTAKLLYTCVLNVVSDLMVMALPLWMLRSLQISKRSKVGLAFVFSVALFCVALDILRTVEAVGQNQDLYTVIEVNVTVMVYCLPTYRRLLGASKLFSRASESSSEVSGRQSSDDGSNWRRSSHHGRKSSAATTNATMVGSGSEETLQVDEQYKARPKIYETRPLADEESQTDEKTLSGRE